MTEDDAPKSAYELAMERLRKKDAESGAESRPITDAQRQVCAVDHVGQEQGANGVHGCFPEP